MIRILVVDDIVPRFKIGYGYPRALTLYNTFSESGFSVTLIPLNAADEIDKSPNTEFNKTIEVINLDKRNDIFQFITENIKAYDAIFISRPKNFRFLIDYLLKLKDKPTIIYDCEAFNALREISRLKLEGCNDKSHFQNLIKEEISLIKRADLIACVSHYELEILRKRIEKELFFLSHFHGNKKSINSFFEREGLLFVGGFYSFPCPNVDALNFFLGEIFPIIKKNIDVNFNIVGYNTERLSQYIPEINNNNISVVSGVDCLYEYYNKARVVVIPTRIGAGISYKLTETLSYGTPSVSTKLIANQVISENRYIGYDNPILFAKRVVALYQQEELWNENRKISLEIIANSYTKEILQNEVLRLKNRLERINVLNYPAG